MRNRAKCGACGDILESKHRHDWVSCSCFKNEEKNTGIFIDGGNDYFRGGGALENLIRIDDEGNEIESSFRRSGTH